jgi:hypothetical protein
LKVIVFAVVGEVCLLLFLDGAASSTEIWARRGVFLTVPFLILAALGIPQVFRVFHKLTLAKFWMFPLLDGQWTAHICSNWPRIRRTYEAAKNGGPKFDALSDVLTEAEERERHVEAEVTITSSLFFIILTLRPVGSNRVSRTRFVRPLWHKPDLPEISYVFEQEDSDPVAQTDIKRHYGAGVLRYDKPKDELSGDYWNDRREDAGLNTAGTIRLSRVSRSVRQT